MLVVDNGSAETLPGTAAFWQTSVVSETVFDLAPSPQLFSADIP
jgi:hypothetical protein